MACAARDLHGPVPAASVNACHRLGRQSFGHYNFTYLVTLPPLQRGTSKAATLPWQACTDGIHSAGPVMRRTSMSAVFQSSGCSDDVAHRYRALMQPALTSYSSRAQVPPRLDTALTEYVDRRGAELLASSLFQANPPGRIR